MSDKNTFIIAEIGQAHDGSLGAAHAYIDPNTGGFFFQTVAPFIYGILGVIVVFWKRITGYVSGLFNRNKDASTPSEDE